MASNKNKPKQTVNVLKRKDAAKFIDQVLLAAGKAVEEAGPSADPKQVSGYKLSVDILEAIMKAGLVLPKPCTGEAHSNPHIDNCGVCLHYEWEWNGTKVKVT